MNATTASSPESTGDELQLALPGSVTSAGAGWDWIAGGWKLFLRAPLMWIIAVILMFIVFIALGLIPILGAIAVQLLQPVISAGFIVACHSLERGGAFELEHLFAGFKKNFANLVVVGLLFLLGGIVILLVFAAIVGLTIGAAFLSGSPDHIASTVMASAFTIILAVLVMLALLVPLFAATWFAPALVVMHDLAPVAAMKASFFACLRNFVPFLVYGIILFLLAIVAAIPFGLGYLVLVPVLMASVYVAYRQIFTEASAPVAAKPTMV